MCAKNKAALTGFISNRGHMSKNKEETNNKQSFKANDSPPCGTLALTQRDLQFQHLLAIHDITTTTTEKSVHMRRWIQKKEGWTKLQLNF